MYLTRFPQKNTATPIAKGLKELGRIFKTMYLLDYFSDKILRKEVQQILNSSNTSRTR
ncbi:MAG: Tn3 family transposase [Fusobacteriaceae bacterium]